VRKHSEMILIVTQHFASRRLENHPTPPALERNRLIEMNPFVWNLPVTNRFATHSEMTHSVMIHSARKLPGTRLAECRPTPGREDK